MTKECFIKDHPEYMRDLTHLSLSLFGTHAVLLGDVIEQALLDQHAESMSEAILVIADGYYISTKPVTDVNDLEPDTWYFTLHLSNHRWLSRVWYVDTKKQICTFVTRAPSSDASAAQIIGHTLLRIHPSITPFKRNFAFFKVRDGIFPNVRSNDIKNLEVREVPTADTHSR